MAPTKAAAYFEFFRGNPLIVKEARSPASPTSTQVTIKAHAIAINPLDYIIQQSGVVIPENAYPFVLGNDIAGEVTAVSDAIKKVKPSDRVIAFAEAGSFQSFNNVDQILLTKLADSVSCTQRSVLPLALCTAAVMLFQHDTLALELPSLDSKPNGKVVVA